MRNFDKIIEEKKEEKRLKKIKGIKNDLAIKLIDEAGMNKEDTQHPDIKLLIKKVGNYDFRVTISNIWVKVEYDKVGTTGTHKKKEDMCYGSLKKGNEVEGLELFVESQFEDFIENIINNQDD